MPTAPANNAVDLDSASRLWSDVSDRLEEFAKAWDTSSSPPEIRSFLPSVESAAFKLTLVEAIKLDVDRRLQRSIERPLEDYLREFPILSDGGLPFDLVYEDFHLRRQSGRSVDPADYYRRFPAVADQLSRLLDSSVLGHSTSVAAAVPQVRFEPGFRVDDFDLLALLGEGQFAQVFLARQCSMQRLVALKVSASRGAEAQTMAQLDHPHIVRVYDQRFLSEQHVQLVYMSYLPGGTLLNVLNEVRATPPERRSGQTLLRAVDTALHARGEMPPPTSPVRAEWAARSWPAAVCTLGMKLARAMDYAHQHGVLHRDIKPANVLLTPDGEPLLADFNIGCCSKVEGAGPAAMFGGSLPYMSPEHIEAFNPAHPRPPDSLDGRADVFSLAVTLWELLAGERPFPKELSTTTWPDLLDELVALRKKGPTSEAIASVSDGDVPGLRELLLRCLDADPSKRPTSAGEMASELSLCLRPATRALVRPVPRYWRDFVRRHPYWTVIIAGVIPNLLAALFNIEYNSEIVEKWKEDRGAVNVFNAMISPLNGIFFPLGVVIFALAMRPIASSLRRTGLTELDGARRRTLRIGAIGAIVCVACWTVAGLTWPIVLRAAAGPPNQGPQAYVHFLASLVICGLIAAAYPYFLITFVAVRVWYPTLLGPGGPNAADQPALDRVDRELSRYRAAATAVPLVGVALLAFRLSVRGESDSDLVAIAVATLSAVGLAGTALAFVLEGKIRKDLAALSAVPV
jgi:serine/threonine protein kinase